MPPREPTGLRRFRTTDDLWERFGEAVERGPDPEADMSKVLRSFVRWYVGEPGAKLPDRPEPCGQIVGTVNNSGSTIDVTCNRPRGHDGDHHGEAAWFE